MSSYIVVARLCGYEWLEHFEGTIGVIEEMFPKNCQTLAQFCQPRPPRNFELAGQYAQFVGGTILPLVHPRQVRRERFEPRAILCQLLRPRDPIRVKRVRLQEMNEVLDGASAVVHLIEVQVK